MGTEGNTNQDVPKAENLNPQEKMQSVQKGIDVEQNKLLNGEQLSDAEKGKVEEFYGKKVDDFQSTVQKMFEDATTEHGRELIQAGLKDVLLQMEKLSAPREKALVELATEFNEFLDKELSKLEAGQQEKAGETPKEGEGSPDRTSVESTSVTTLETMNSSMANLDKALDALFLAAKEHTHDRGGESGFLSYIKGAFRSNRPEFSAEMIGQYAFRDAERLMTHVKETVDAAKNQIGVLVNHLSDSGTDPEKIPIIVGNLIRRSGIDQNILPELLDVLMKAMDGVCRKVERQERERLLNSPQGNVYRVLEQCITLVDRADSYKIYSLMQALSADSNIANFDQLREKAIQLGSGSDEERAVSAAMSGGLDRVIGIVEGARISSLNGKERSILSESRDMDAIVEGLRNWNGKNMEERETQELKRQGEQERLQLLSTLLPLMADAIPSSIFKSSDASIFNLANKYVEVLGQKYQEVIARDPLGHGSRESPLEQADRAAGGVDYVYGEHGFSLYLKDFVSSIQEPFKQITGIRFQDFLSGRVSVPAGISGEADGEKMGNYLRLVTAKASLTLRTKDPSREFDAVENGRNLAHEVLGDYLKTAYDIYDRNNPNRTKAMIEQEYREKNSVNEIVKSEHQRQTVKTEVVARQTKIIEEHNKQYPDDQLNMPSNEQIDHIVERSLFQVASKKVDEMAKQSADNEALSWLRDNCNSNGIEGYSKLSMFREIGKEGNLMSETLNALSDSYGYGILNPSAENQATVDYLVHEATVTAALMAISMATGNIAALPVAFLTRKALYSGGMKLMESAVGRQIVSLGARTGGTSVLAAVPAFLTTAVVFHESQELMHSGVSGYMRGLSEQSIGDRMEAWTESALTLGAFQATHLLYASTVGKAAAAGAESIGAIPSALLRGSSYVGGLETEAATMFASMPQGTRFEEALAAVVGLRIGNKVGPGRLVQPVNEAIAEGMRDAQNRKGEKNGEKITEREGGVVGRPEINKQNAKTTLLEEKGRSETEANYELRKECLVKSEGTSDPLLQITTHDAYTYGEMPRDANLLKKFLDDPNNWLPERRVLHERLLNDAFELAKRLSERLQDPVAIIYMLRGNTAVGKTTQLKIDDFFKRAVENGEVTGAINPDIFKHHLKTDGMKDGKQTLTANQVHEESSMLARKLKEMIDRSNPPLSRIVDKRFDSSKSVQDILKESADSGKPVKILDIDAPLETSCVRVLTRVLGGPDPAVPFCAVAEGLEGIRQNRLALIGEVRSNPMILNYVLYVTGADGKSVKVAEKVDGKFTISNEELFKKASEDKRTLEEVERVKKVVLTDDYILSTPEWMRVSLERYKSKTLEEALNLHEQLLNEPRDATYYLRKAMNNLKKTSRTAGGVMDTSASKDKAAKMADGLSGDKASELAVKNFERTTRRLFEQRSIEFKNPQELQAFVEGIGRDINAGITKEGVLIRSGEDSAKYPYVRINDLPQSMEQFYQEFFQKLNDPSTDPVRLAAWIEYRVNFTDHLFADGCGKASLAIGTFVLMRYNMKLPAFVDKSGIVQFAAKTVRGVDPVADAKALDDLTDYFRKLMEAP